ncbi:unnamed protein product [Psylliodes chrysocephalus]|uniref:EF-hand domain-containing protein n=1 Tax=Psylliodes chrysocephalus TaxID=3402493 RepID=A0A9P0D2C5_9CUCU|nr:unnamed protein product [Psylliodes chrysocephala]
MIAAAEKFDADKSGHIEINELVEMLKSDDDVPKIISKKIFKAADQDGNGLLNYDEFEKMVQDENYSEVFSRYLNIYIRYVLPRKKAALLQADSSIPDGIYEDKYSFWPPPVALILITALEITFFIIDEVSKDTASYDDGRMSNILIYHPYKRQEAWRFFTYMFVHIGYMHLVINLSVQLCLGVPLEMVHKWKRILVVYFSGVIAGSLCTSVVDPTTFLAGASGGVYALLTAHIGTICMNWREMEFPIIQLLVFLAIVSMDVGTSIYNRYFLHLEENIGYAAHFGGALAGLLVGIWNLKNFAPTKRETYVWWCALTIYVMFMGTMILMNIVWKEHFLPNR